MNYGVVFGVFDGLHPGHRWFLRQAREHCSQLTVVVAHDAVVFRRKHRWPKETLTHRIGRIQRFYPQLTVIPGDAQEGEWSVFKRIPPIDFCIVGYDQIELRNALTLLKRTRSLSFGIIVLAPHRPHRYKSSLYVRPQISPRAS